FFEYLYKIIYLIFLHLFVQDGLYSIKLLIAVRVRWAITAREISPFPSGGPFQRVRFLDFRAVDHSCARDFSILERWTTPARRIRRSPSDRTLPRVRFRDSRAVERSNA